jgi:acetyltransferase-like isoleucine patch superfamily enzyme
MKIHKTADVQTRKIGKNTFVWQYTIILEGAYIGKNCNINAHCFIENDVTIGDNVTIKCGNYIWDGITMESDVFIGPNVSFTNDLNPRSKFHNKKFLQTNIKQGASIGAGATILPGLTIGKYSMIGAGSVVTKSIPNYSLWYGTPAIFKAFICKCGTKINETLVCTNCGTKYKQISNFEIEPND